MSAEFDVISRLRALADVPVDEAVAARHAELLEAAPVPSWSAKGKWRTMVAGGTLVAALVGGTGIAAAAGNLPDPVQNAAHSALAKVGVDVPKARSTEGCGGKEYKNHGQFVKDQPKTGEARSAAAKSKCGKPLTAGTDDADADEDKGKPADAGGGAGAGGGKATAPGQTGDAGKSGEDHGSKPETTPSGSAPGKSGSAPGQSKSGK